MSLECSDCQRVPGGPHDPFCPRDPLVRAIRLLVSNVTDAQIASIRSAARASEKKEDRT